GGKCNEGHTAVVGERLGRGAEKTRRIHPGKRPPAAEQSSGEGNRECTGFRRCCCNGRFAAADRRFFCFWRFCFGCGLSRQQECGLGQSARAFRGPCLLTGRRICPL